MLEMREPAVIAHHHGEAVNDLDAAYEAIPEGERETWYERAERGVPEWMRITAVVREMALTLWVGETIPVLAPG